MIIRRDFIFIINALLSLFTTFMIELIHMILYGGFMFGSITRVIVGLLIFVLFNQNYQLNSRRVNKWQS